MKTSLKAVLWAVISALCLVPGLGAEQKITVAVFPFTLETSQPGDQMKTSLPKMLKEKLEQEGANVLFVEDFSDKEAWSREEFRQTGIRLGADRIITGNIFVAGKRISIDAQMRNVYEVEKPPLTFFSQADSVEGLMPAVTGLSRSIIGELFEKRIIAAITVAGNRRVESDAVLRVISSRTGDIMSQEKLSKDLADIYKMGYFDDVVVKKKDLDRGLEIIFQVKEKPSVRNVRFKNNDVYDDEELFEVVETNTGSILNVYKINADVERIKRLYMEKNYHNIQIQYDIKTLDNAQADIIFIVEEGEKLRIESITFDGNHHFDADDIRDVMQTKEKGFWSFLTSSGDLDETELDNDVIRIESLYKNNGFINVKVSDALITLGQDSITVSFKIDEGSQYKTSLVDIVGDLIDPREELLEKLKAQESELYNRELVRQDMLVLNDLYANRGYANAKISPMVKKDDDKKTVNIFYKIDKGELVYFNRIIISGNAKTRDKVIRREMAVEEQGLYSMTGIQRSHRNLTRQDYFQSVEIKPVPTDVPDQRNVEVKVQEKSTGNFSFGGGFSSDDGAFGQVSLEERNLFGRGQRLKLMGRMSGKNALYDLGFTEPWLFDRPISGGANIYKLEKEYDYYERDSYGLTLKSSYRQIWDYTAIGLEYNVEKFEVYNADRTYTNVTEGDFFTSSIKPYISYDSRNHYFLPTEGIFSKVSVQYAGDLLGGDIDYTKYLAEGGFWIPLFWKFTGGFNAEIGYLDDRTGGAIDIDWERFYLGGINSIRGFDDTDINAREQGETILRGGEKYLQFNLEMIFPIQAEMGVYGVMFYDRGDVYRTSESFDLGDQYSSAGFELRWNSPMGPIRLAYGFVLEGQDTKDTWDSQFDFSIGAFF